MLTFLLASSSVLYINWLNTKNLQDPDPLHPHSLSVQALLVNYFPHPTEFIKSSTGSSWTAMA